MTSVQSRLSRVSAAALAAALLAAPAAAKIDAYLKIPDIPGEASDSAHRGQIEIQSFSWGETQSGTHVGGGGGGAGKVSMAVEREMKESGEKGGTEDINIGVGELQEARKGNVETEWKVEEGESAAPAKAGDVTLKRGSGIQASGEPAAGLPTGKRQHRPMAGAATRMDKATPKLAEAVARGKVYAAPLARGSLTALVPAGSCRIGARYPAVELVAGGKTHRLADVTIVRCASAAASGDRPMEQLSLNYAEVE